MQRGFAMIAVLALIALISAFLIASALSRTAVDASNEREDRSMSALRKAKAALIAHAANEQWQLYKALPKTPTTDPSVYFQPGALACPDQDDDGDADCTLPNTANLIGRVPYKTIGLDDLRDASGERLWYALSHDFRKLQCTSPGTPAGCTVINSDTLGQLTVLGIAPATQVLAVLFAPGEALDLTAFGGVRQDRIAGHNDPLNYLEGPPVVPTGSTNWIFTTALPSAAFNDRVLIITQAELMAAVEPVVAANIERDIGKGLLQDYFSKWGRYPFAVQGPPPPASQSAYLGSSSPATTNGLLPVTDTATFTWASATVTDILGSGTGIYTNPTNHISPNPTNCSISLPPPPLIVTCTFTYSGGLNDRPDIRLEVFLSNANSAFVDTPSATPAENVTIKDGQSPPQSVSNQGTPYGFWSNVGLFEPTLTFVAQSAGGALTYIGRLQNANSMSNGATISFQLPAPPGYLPRLTNPRTTDPNIAWFLSNQWYRQAYYAMSLGFAPGGVPTGNPAACNPPVLTAPPCLTVNNLLGQTNNKQAILVLAGRALAGQDRSIGNLGDYFEAQNSTPADLIFEHRAGSATTINDRVVVVSP